MNFKSLKPLVLLTQLAIQMIVPIFLCLLLGKWLDSLFKTSPILLIIFVILGVGAGIRNMYLTVKKMGEEE